MGAESPHRVGRHAGAVFLSYASQDTAAAQRICEVLRAAGIDVWFDQSELRGGDLWDQKIRRQIRDCALFIPVVSANTASRHEGYFRLEWDLADQRSHMMARDRAFIVPVCLDATPGAGTDVPESFHRVQWTRLPGGETSPEFAARIARLLSPEPATAAPQITVSAPSAALLSHSAGRPAWLRGALRATTAVLAAIALAYLLVDKLRNQAHVIGAPLATPGTVTASSPGPLPAPPAGTAFSPPPHSIAVLPFVNISGDKKQEYFSDGLSEELLNDLARMSELQVAARTSAFSFKGKDTDIGAIARQLNVGTVLEGSVRRSARKVRVTAQLINTVTGFHMWSETYERDLTDVLNLQTDIATAVTSALKVTLLGDMADKFQLGGTRNPAAFDAFLRAYQKAWYDPGDGEKNLKEGIAGLSEAIRLDPNYALAFAVRSRALSDYAASYANTVPAIRKAFDQAHADARKAITLAPDFDESHLSLALWYETASLNFAQANDEYERALALAPGNVRVQIRYSEFAAAMGRTEASIAAARRAVVLDPLHANVHLFLGKALFFARRYNEAIAAFQDALTLSPGDKDLEAQLGYLYYLLGDFQRAREFCERKPSHGCLAITYDKLGRRADAEDQLAKLKALWGDSGAVTCASVYAQWGSVTKGLEWLEVARRLRDPALELLKTHPAFDPLRKEPRFQAIVQELRFPD